MSSVSDYASKGDSVSLAKIDEKPFTVIGIEDSNYEQGGETTEGVKITTKEKFKIDGEEFNKFHTTRIAIVKFLKREDVRANVNGGTELGPVKVVQDKTKSGKDFFNLVDATPTQGKIA